MAVVICGCTSTQTTAARLRLNDDRIRASEEPVKATQIGTSPTVTVGAVTVLSTSAGYAAVVTLRNRGRATSDLPLLVGYRLRGRTVYLNAGAQSNYFNNHTPAIAGHGSLTWVEDGTTRLPTRTRPSAPRAQYFAVVGAKPASPAGSGFTLPDVTATAAKDTVQVPASVVRPSPSYSAHPFPSQSETVEVHVTNHSSIPQYQLPVYAVLMMGNHVVSAAAASVATLNGGAKVTVKVAIPIALLGGAATFNLRVESPATIFK